MKHSQCSTFVFDLETPLIVNDDGVSKATVFKAIHNTNPVILKSQKSGFYHTQETLLQENSCDNLFSSLFLLSKTTIINK